MKKTLIILAALAALVYAVAAGMQWLTPRVEKDLTDRVNVALAEQGLLWADVEVDGRNVTLSGEAPDAELRDRALAAAARVFGVAQVTDALTVGDDNGQTQTARASKSYILAITKRGGNVTLEGMVDNEQSRDVIERIAATHYGKGNVTSNLTVAEGAPAGWRSAVGTVLFNMVNLEDADARLAGREIMVSGTVVDEMYSTQLSDQLGAALPREYKLAMAVDVALPEAADAEPAAGEEIIDTDNMDVATVENTGNSPTTTAENRSESGSFLPTQLAEKLASVRKTVTGTETAPAAVQNCGGADTATIAEARIYFDFDRAAVKPEYEQTAKNVAAALKNCADLSVEVAGYTDTTGSALYNQWLSEQRAEAGARALVRNGVARKRLTTKGYGEVDQPGDNSTREGRALNRRVEFHP